MSRVFCVADLHFGHTNMALHRGFKSTEEHDELIIYNWNKVICKRDVVYILGDLTMEKDLYAQYLPKLNGIKNIVLGNHDMPQHVPSLLKYVNKVSGMFDYKGGVLTHCPIHPMEIADRGYLFNIHGHIHEKTINDNRYKCVSLEQINYQPILMNEILTQMYNEKNNNN